MSGLITPPQVALVNNFRSCLPEGMAAHSCTMILDQTQGLPRLYNDSILFLTAKRLSDNRTEQVKVTSIAGNSLQVQRAVGGEPIDFYPGDIVYSALTAEVLNCLLAAIRSVNVSLCDTFDLSFIPPMSACDLGPLDKVEYQGPTLPINVDQALNYLYYYMGLLWRHVDCNHALIDSIKLKDLAKIWTTICDVQNSLGLLRIRVDDLDARFTAIECCCDRLEARINDLQSQIDALTDRVNDLEDCVEELKNEPDPVIPNTQALCGCGSEDTLESITVEDGRTVLVWLNIPQLDNAGASITVEATLNGGQLCRLDSVGITPEQNTFCCGIGPSALDFNVNVSGTGILPIWAYIIC